MKATEITDMIKCTGCALCESVCPKQCISMIFSDEGFKYPFIDESACIDCGLCVKKCPVNSPMQNDEEYKQKALLAINKDSSIYYKSSSGGVFFELAQNILKGGGAVYGASWDDNFICRHICVERIEDVYKLLGSKYVQSDISGIWQNFRQKVTSGCKVLFSGTPCQIGAVRSLFHAIPENLLLVEVICMGVPSPIMFDYYLKDIQAQLGSQIKSVTFRDKKFFGESRSHSLIITDVQGKKYARTRNNDPFFNQFLLCNSLRKACYRCSFKSRQRAADITLGDCWGMHDIALSKFGKEVVSLVIINSQSGSSNFGAIADHFNVTDVPMSLVLEKQPMLTESCHPGRLRYALFKDAPLNNGGEVFNYLKKISGFGYKQAIKSWLVHLKYGKK